ncbi:MAG TPA: SCP2 sterol-binding domain-containing protein [Anaerolineales bacterium]|nr:SCP2 sterol-binding domain-containing protein [Anaerolineales bacterium]
MSPTINELMTETIKTAFVPEKAAGVDTVIQFKFTGAQASEWYVIVKDQQCQSVQGVHPNPKMTMTVDSNDYIKMSIGEMDPNMAFLKGKVKVTGDMGVALNMGKYFKYGKPNKV